MTQSESSRPSQLGPPQDQQQQQHHAAQVEPRGAYFVLDTLAPASSASDALQQSSLLIRSITAVGLVPSYCASDIITRTLFCFLCPFSHATTHHSLHRTVPPPSHSNCIHSLSQIYLAPFDPPVELAVAATASRSPTPVSSRNAARAARLSQLSKSTGSIRVLCPVQ